jgi:hypothetical protein
VPRQRREEVDSPFGDEDDDRGVSVRFERLRSVAYGRDVIGDDG